MKNTIFILFICLFTLSCKSGQTKSDNSLSKIGTDTTALYQFDFEEGMKNRMKVDTVTINSIAKKINFIPLNDSRESLLSNTHFLLHKINGNYLASSYSRGVMLFDSLGGFDKLLVDFGKSNREIPSKLYTWAVNEHLNMLTIACGRRFISYSCLDESIRGVPLERYYYGIILLNDSSYVALPNLKGKQSKDEPYLSFLNHKGKVIKSRYYKMDKDLYYDMPTGYNGPMETYGLYSNYDGNALFRDMFNDTIYKVSARDDVRPYVVCVRGLLTPKLEDADNRSKKDETIYIRNVSETAEYILVKYAYQNSIFCSIWSKASKKMILNTKLDLDSKTPLINCRYFFNYTTPNNENIVVGVVSVTKDKLFGIVMSKDAMKFLPGISEFSNPVVMEILLDN